MAAPHYTFTERTMHAPFTREAWGWIEGRRERSEKEVFVWVRVTMVIYSVIVYINVCIRAILFSCQLSLSHTHTHNLLLKCLFILIIIVIYILLYSLLVLSTDAGVTTLT